MIYVFNGQTRAITAYNSINELPASMHDHDFKDLYMGGVEKEWRSQPMYNNQSGAASFMTENVVAMARHAGVKASVLAQIPARHRLEPDTGRLYALDPDNDVERDELGRWKCSGTINL